MKAPIALVTFEHHTGVERGLADLAGLVLRRDYLGIDVGSGILGEICAICCHPLIISSSKFDIVLVGEGHSLIYLPAAGEVEGVLGFLLQYHKVLDLKRWM